MKSSDYWTECVSGAANDIGLVLTPEQIDAIAYAVEVGHDNYGLAFYQPPASDLFAHEEREWQKKYNQLKVEFDKYCCNSEEAIKIALHQRPDAQVTIGEFGEVLRHGGRTDRIQ